MKKYRKRALSAAFNRVAPPPPPPRDGTVELFHNIPVADPYRPLERDGDPIVRDWLAAQERRVRQALAGSPLRDSIRRQARAALARPAAGAPMIHGKRQFRWYTAADPRALRCLQSRKGDKGKWRTLLDPRRLPAAQDHRGDLLSLSCALPSHDGRFVVYGYAVNGRDEMTLCVRDVETGSDLPETIDGVAHTTPLWCAWGDKTGFLLIRRAGGDGGYDCTFHAVDDGHIAPPEIFFNMPDPALTASFSFYADRSWITLKRGCAPERGILVADDQGKWQTVLPPDQAAFAFAGFRDDVIYAVTGAAAPDEKTQTPSPPAGSRLVRFAAAEPYRVQWQTVIPVTPGFHIEDADIHADAIIVRGMRDRQQVLAVYDRDGVKRHEAALPPHSRITRIAGAYPDLTLTLSTPAQREAPYRYDACHNVIVPAGAGESLLRPADYIVENLIAPGKDGTPVTMQAIRHKDTRRDGSAALLLDCYGGFNEKNMLDYSVMMALWLRQGGIYVTPHLRGGGEDGPAHNQGGRGKLKQNTYDDLAACARYLAKKRYSSAARTVLYGGSNGGLTVLAAMLQQPGLYGAVIADVPVTDMLRFDRTPAGRSWMCDYGDPRRVAADFNAVMDYSPLHNVRAGIACPPCLVRAGVCDDRVPPAHAYKFVAALQEAGDPDNIVLLHAQKRTGHQAVTRMQWARAYADFFAFAARAVGPLAQEAYRAEKRAKIHAEKQPGKQANALTGKACQASGASYVAAQYKALVK